MIRLRIHGPMGIFSMVGKRNSSLECLGEVATFLAKLGERVCRPFHVLEREEAAHLLKKEEREINCVRLF